VNILKEIIEHKREEIKRAKSRQSLATIKAHLDKLTPSISSFTETLVNRAQKKQIAIIAEIKQKSPSHGLIREDFDLLNIVQSYIQGGACCLSILTDEKYFAGRLTYIKKVKAFCSLPVLRKDFIIDTYQIFESKLAHADAILLLANTLSATQLQEFEEQANDLGLDVLIEIHHQEDIKKIEKCRSPIIGINNRNLHYFTTDINHCIQLKKELPQDKFIVCESGVRSPQDICLVTENGIYIFLIGKYLMQQKNSEEGLRKLIETNNDNSH
jgi:indole-3-glycerol phosphate synthase